MTFSFSTFTFSTFKRFSLTATVVLLATALSLSAGAAEKKGGSGDGGEKGSAGGKKNAKKPPPKKEDDGKVGYGDSIVQMSPMMVPTTTSTGIRYEVLTLRISLPPGDMERPGCFMVPIIHEKILMYLFGAHLQEADFEGQRRDVLQKNLMDVVIQATDKNFYTGLTLVDDNTPPLEPKSQTLSSQCK